MCASSLATNLLVISKVVPKICARTNSAMMAVVTATSLNWWGGGVDGRRSAVRVMHGEDCSGGDEVGGRGDGWREAAEVWFVARLVGYYWLLSGRCGSSLVDVTRAADKQAQGAAAAAEGEGEGGGRRQARSDSLKLQKQYTICSPPGGALSGTHPLAHITARRSIVDDRLQ